MLGNVPNVILKTPMWGKGCDHMLATAMCHIRLANVATTANVVKLYIV